MIVVAIDIGGTFTDLIGFDTEEGRFVEAKSLTTPAQLTRGITDCIRKSGLNPAAIDELIHGSTIAINTLIERKGAKVGLIVTRGTRDVYLIGRGNRPEAYNLFFHGRGRSCRATGPIEVAERMYASGEVREPLNVESVKAACDSLKTAGVDAVAVCFLHSYANPEHERIAGKIIEEALPGRYVSLVARNIARIPRVRAHVHYGRKRLYRPEGRRLCPQSAGKNRKHSVFGAILR